ncbi:MAG: hypothetical protein OXI66_20200 [Boseongicola sp.]|nr:hypothetical protein [Boseongicola sp.]
MYGLVNTATLARVPNVLWTTGTFPVTLDPDTLHDPPKLDLGASMA